MIHAYVAPEWRLLTQDSHVVYGNAWGKQFNAARFLLFPTPEALTSHEINRDYLVSRAELSVRSAFSQSFSYKGHTWNPVESGSCKGSLYNIPTAGLGYQSVPTGYYNPLTGDDHYYDHIIFFDAPSDYVAPISGVAFNNNLYRGYLVIWTFRSDDLLYVWPAHYIWDKNGKIATGGWYTMTQVRLYRRDPETGYLYTESYSALSRTHLADGTLFKDVANPNAYQSIGEIHALWLQVVSADATYRKSQPGLSYLYARGRRIAASETSPPDIPMPNYEAVFTTYELTHGANWPAMAASAYSGARFSDINGIANVKELIGYGEQIQSFARVLKQIPHSAVKNTAAAWLAIHYGFKLTILDLEGLCSELNKQAYRRSSLSRLTAAQTWSVGDRTYTARYQVFYDQFAKVESLFQQLLQISDFQLTAENLWDMVPWSFVVDWFIGIGDVIATIDDYANLTQNHEVICCGRSVKGSTSLKFANNNWHTNGLQMSRYFRWYEKELQLPSLTPEVTVNPFNHYVEGAALVISIR